MRKFLIAAATLSVRAAPAAYGNRKPITLSTKPLSTIAPIEDELDEEFAEFAKALMA